MEINMSKKIIKLDTPTDCKRYAIIDDGSIDWDFIDALAAIPAPTTDAYNKKLDETVGL